MSEQRSLRIDRERSWYVRTDNKQGKGTRPEINESNLGEMCLSMSWYFTLVANHGNPYHSLNPASGFQDPSRRVVLLGTKTHLQHDTISTQGRRASNTLPRYAHQVAYRPTRKIPPDARVARAVQATSIGHASVRTRRCWSDPGCQGVGVCEERREGGWSAGA